MLFFLFSLGGAVDIGDLSAGAFFFLPLAGRAKSVNLGDLSAYGGGRGTANYSNYSKLRRLLLHLFVEK